MSLAPGARLGPYEIIADLGAGGMGEVYRARDSRLRRDVAVKVIAAELVADGDRLQRFEREARAAASLNHPNILAVHDVGTADGTPYIVSELVDGETLAAHLARGSIPVRKAIDYGIQIARGLAAAHEKGMAHRDLKPANVCVTRDGRAKILDFGIAKFSQPERGASDRSDVTTTLPETETGKVLGTVGYMAPEQVRGLSSDHRADIFAFGALLYEMLAGRRAFPGQTNADALTAVLKEDPAALPLLERRISPALARIVERCLEKDPSARFQSAIDLAFALEAVASPADQSATGTVTVDDRLARPRTRLAWPLFAVGGVALTVGLGLLARQYFQPALAPMPAYRSSLLAPEGTDYWTPSTSSAALMALSPDGKSLAYMARDDSNELALWIRRLDEAGSRRLAGTEGGAFPFWSPDSRQLGFISQGRLKTISASGGPVVTLTDGLTYPCMATWNQKNTILFTKVRQSPLLSIPATGGAITEVTQLRPEDGDTAHNWPWFLPDGRHFLYVAVGSKSNPDESRAIYVGSLDEGETDKLVLQGGSNAKYAAGHLIFIRERVLMAQPFDLDEMTLTGEAVPLAEDIAVGGATGANGPFTVSQTGILAYRIGLGSGTGVLNTSRLVWFDRTGREVSVLPTNAAYGDVELSPDGKRLAVSIQGEPRNLNRDIWLLDLAREVSQRLTIDATNEQSAVWSPDGSRIVFDANRKDSSDFDLYQISTSGVGSAEPLLTRPFIQRSYSWSRDGRYILYQSQNAATQSPDLWALPLSGDRKEFQLTQTPFMESSARFAPNGRWISYTSNETGRGSDVYVLSFPVPDRKVRISTSGGGWARWREDGKELFYVDASSALMAVEIETSESGFHVGSERRLFQMRAVLNARYPYAVSADGQRFLINTLPDELATTAPVSLLVNWPAALNK